MPTAVPLAVPPPVASRQSPDSTPTTVPSEFSRHCWLAPPVQVHICTPVPALAAWLGTSRHMLPYTVSWLLEVCVHCWLAPPQQSKICRLGRAVWRCADGSR